MKIIFSSPSLALVLFTFIHSFFSSLYSVSTIFIYALQANGSYVIYHQKPQIKFKRWNEKLKVYSMVLYHDKSYICLDLFSEVFFCCCPLLFYAFYALDLLSNQCNNNQQQNRKSNETVNYLTNYAKWKMDLVLRWFQGFFDRSIYFNSSHQRINHGYMVHSS